MAQPKEGVSEWMLERAREYGIKDWKDKGDLSSKIYKAKKEKSGKASGGGLAALDKVAETAVVKSEAVKVIPDTKVEVLPSSAKVDVQAPVINVHVPAPGVTITGYTFAWFPAFKATFNWMQAAVIGAAFYAALSSRLGELITLAVR